MTHLPSLPEDAKLLDVFRAYPDTARPLIDYHQALMRDESPLSEAQRELIAAYVSGLNACDYCYGIHQTTAQAFGVDEGPLTALLVDLETANIDEPMRALLQYVSKLTTDPAKVTPAWAQHVLDAGWSERALHDTVSVCAVQLHEPLNNGLGVTADPDYADLSGDRLARSGYAGLKKLL